MRKLGALSADIVGLQEVRSPAHQLPKSVTASRTWDTAFTHAQRPGYSGVGLLSRLEPEACEESLGEPRFDDEARLQIAKFGRLQVANVYFPNGNGQDRDNSRVPFKLDFYRALFDKLSPAFERGEPVLVMGDFNTAHQAIDLARPTQNKNTSGFLEEERREFGRWLDAGYVDSFRHFVAEAGHYTWWSQRQGVRERNVGWRIDYVLVSPGALPYLRRAHIHHRVMGSDHCPISVQLDRTVLGG